MPDTRTDWWSHLYAPVHSDTASADRPPTPPRIPPPGQTITLGKPEPEPEPEPTAPGPPVDAEPGEEPDEPDHDDEPADADQPTPDTKPDGWTDIPDRTAPPDQQAVLSGTARIHQAVATIPGRLRWLTYNSTAAGTGWCCHLVQPFQALIATCGVATGSQVSAVILGAGICTLIGWRWDRPTRGWWGPLPWACRIPLASAVVALALYAPGTGH